jgi:hypothetical protein
VYRQQINNKRAAYRFQDIKKGFYDSALFVSYDDIVSILRDARLVCYYCKHPIYILYDYVYEKSQWTLDRLYNNRGHNRDNVVACCLECNLHRRVTHHGKFKQTCDMYHFVKRGTTQQGGGDDGTAV